MLNPPGGYPSFSVPAAAVKRDIEVSRKKPKKPKARKRGK